MSKAPTKGGFPVVAIGASAGGLEACRALLKDMPADASAAFVLILHLDPSHDSMMVDLLAGHTRLNVVQAAEGMALKPGCLYVIPPGSFLTVTQRTLHLAGPDGGKSVRLPFDVLLRSLASDVGDASACLVLSGTGTDGSLGLARIHDAGGLVIAQEPQEAGYPGMSESAIATGLVARVLPLGQMFAALEAHFGAVATRPAPTPADRRAVDARSADYDDVLSYLREHAAQDLSLYKRGTLERRVARRMALLGLGAAETTRYLGILKADPEERAHLAADLLIHVTSFFRDPEVFEHLSKTAIPGLVKAMSGDRPLRVWVAGCSTGEEAYGLAMLCLEAMDAAGTRARLQVLASDADPEAIATARAGYYPKDIEAVVSPARLARFFVPEDGGWRVTSVLRDAIVFTVADLLSDPPFSRIDLVSCRNVLIYLGPEAQRRVVARCCFALRQGGLLLLGAAEMPGPGDRCFAIEDKGARLWRRVGQSHPAELQFAAGRREDAVSPLVQSPVRESALADLCRRILLEQYAPAAVLLNSRLECLYLLGPTEKFLKITQGHHDPGILGMLPKVLRARFRAAAAACSPARPLISVSGGRNQEAAGFDIAIHSATAGAEPLILACFMDGTRAAAETARSEPAASATGDMGNLEADLEAVRSDLFDALRDLEQEVEAHSADAAEALSVNEEFQSTNEELLASKEELQSLNEELTALNSQLQETLERHRTTANDLQNVLYSADVATLFLDIDLNIRFFTPAAREIFRVIPTDVGRPLSDLSSMSRDDDLETDARAVLASADPKEREIAALGERWFLRRVQPYRAQGGRVEGVVITYVDITERKRTNAALRASMDESERATRAKSRFLAAASHDLRQPLQSMALLHTLIARQKRSTEGVRLAKLLDQSLNAMTELLDSMLDVNRIDSGIVRPEVRPIPLALLLRRLVEEFEPLCAEKGLGFRFVPTSTWVSSDPQLLGQILRNLLSNALKYTPKGGILMGCRRHGAQVTIVVCDTGIGVSESEFEAIFEPYRQGENASALAGPGLGLGLSIVQRLAHLLGHAITVRSTPGKGSAFMVSLPMVAAGHEAPPRPRIASVRPSTERQTGTILLVEDEGQLRDLLAEVLEKEGHTVVSMPDALSALAWADGDAARPDLLLTDYDLHGGTNGLTLAEDLTHVLGGNPVPSIILTGDITTATMKRLANSACKQVTKPVMPEVLLALISDLLLKARAEKSRPAGDSEPPGASVHVIDDNPIVRETMRRLFEAEGWVVVTHSSAEEFLAAPRPGVGACLLVDNVLPGMDGVALATLLRSTGLQLPVVMLTAYGDARMAVAALRCGVSDLIEKPASAVDLLASVRHAIKTARPAHAQTDTEQGAQRRFAGLTQREREVLGRVLSGAPNKIIAADLGINQRTVENHRASVMRKTGAASLPALVRLALAAGVQSVT